MRGLNQLLSGLRDWRLSTKLAALMFVVALVPLVVVVVQSDLRIRGELEARQRADLQSMANDTATRIDEALLESKLKLLTFAENPELARYAADPAKRSDTADDALSSLLDLFRLETSVDTAFLASPRGEVIMAVGAVPSGTLADRDFFKATVSGTASISDLERQESGKQAYYVTAPLRDKQNAVTLVLAMRVVADKFERLIESDLERLGPGSEAALWDRRGARLSGAAEEAAAPVSAQLSRLLSDIGEDKDRGGNQSDELTARFDHQDGARLVAADPLGNKSWVYTVHQPEAVVLESLSAATRVSAIIFLAVLVIVLGASLGLAAYLSRPLGDLQRVANAIRFGDYSARAQLTGSDEIGLVGASINQMLDEVTTLVQTREERDQIQQQIITLLSEVSTAAEGDLTVEAQVTDGALGSVADAFNYMVGELRTIIANVNATTVQVSSSSGEILAASSLLVRNAGAQAAQIVSTTRAIDEMSGSISRVSENARVSAQVAVEARQNARLGLQSVQATIGGMQRIRVQVQQTAKQIKRLGESSQEIGQIVQVIEEMADQTNLLALNAAIQAAMAGEHGRGFAVVAEEVRRLAERATSATKQISMLVKSIQAETTQAVIAMENNTVEVVEGSRLADTAGQSLESIDTVVSRMAELSEAISQAAEQQAEASRDIARAMAEINQVTETTTTGSQQTAESVGALARLADQLRSSVATFRLSKSEA